MDIKDVLGVSLFRLARPHELALRNPANTGCELFPVLFLIDTLEL